MRIGAKYLLQKTLIGKDASELDKLGDIMERSKPMTSRTISYARKLFTAKLILVLISTTFSLTLFPSIALSVRINPFKRLCVKLIERDTSLEQQCIATCDLRIKKTLFNQLIGVQSRIDIINVSGICDNGVRLYESLCGSLMDVEITGISITSESDRLYVGDSMAMNAEIYGHSCINGTLKGNMRWYSSNPEIATIDRNKGIVSGVSVGTTFIQVFSRDIPEIASISVPIKVIRECNEIIDTAGGMGTINIISTDPSTGITTVIATHDWVVESEGHDSVCDENGTLHVVYSIELWIGTIETYYIYRNNEGWSAPILLSGVRASSPSMTIDRIGYWEIVYLDAFYPSKIQYYNSNTGRIETLATLTNFVDLEKLESSRLSNNEDLNIYYEIELFDGTIQGYNLSHY